MNNSFPPSFKKAKSSPRGRNNLPSFQICYILNNHNLISSISKTRKVSMKLSSLTKNKSNACGYNLDFPFAVKRYLTPQVFLLTKAVKLGIMVSKKILCDSSLIRFHKKWKKSAFSYFSSQEEFLSVMIVTKDSVEIRIMFTHSSASKQA